MVETRDATFQSLDKPRPYFALEGDEDVQPDPPRHLTGGPADSVTGKVSFPLVLPHEPNVGVSPFRFTCGIFQLCPVSETTPPDLIH